MIQKYLTLLVLLFASISGYSQVFEGVATHFDGLGLPYGGCGVPPSLVETDDYVALNVYASPGVGTMWTRPLKDADTVHMGMFANGTNCGRWIKVTMGEDCIDGTNDGALGQPFCRGANGKWVNDQYSGSTLYMIVTDACGDNNGWCRDNKYHLDLHSPSLNRFRKNGVSVNDMLPLHFNNRKMSWEFVEAPNYSGDIALYFMKGAQYYWPAIMINHLQNGISKVEQKINGKWVIINPNSDMGQAFILKDFTQPYTIRAYDSNGNLINGGREYSFSLPTSCNGTCTDPATSSSFTSHDSIITQNISLQKGWNLISLNIVPSNKSIDTIIRPISSFISEIKTSDAFWHNNQVSFLNSLATFTAGKAYYIYNSSSSTIQLSIQGTAMTPINFNASLKSGWNMVGCQYRQNKPFSSIIDLTTIKAIKDFDGFWDGSTASQLLMMEPGKGYWIKL
jgi:hypothetical protein